MKRLMSPFLALSLMLLLASSVRAATLTGSFSSTGNFVPVTSTGVQSNIATATALDFIQCYAGAPNGCTPPQVAVPSPTPGTAGQFLVTSATGDFASLGLLNQIGSIKDLTFSGTGNANYPTAPISMFEVVIGSGGTLTFDLNAVTIVQQGPGILQLSGTGMFSATNYDDTYGTWSFLGQAACQPNQSTCTNPPYIETWVFTALNSIPRVAEPSPLVLLGLGLIGLAAWGRLRIRRPNSR